MKLSTIKPEDLYKIQFVSDPQISPDGSQVVFCVKWIDDTKNCYRTHLWLADINTKKYLQFSNSPGNDNHPRWSPDGSMIAFVRSSDERTQIWIIPANGGEAKPLTSIGEGSIGTITWSPDGSKIAFVFRPTHPDWSHKAIEHRQEGQKSNPPREITRLHYRLEGAGFLDCYQHIWVCDITSGESIQVTDGAWDDRDPAWTPDSKWITIISNRSHHPEQTPFKEDIWKVNPENEDLVKIPTNDGYKQALSWSPDGKYLAFLGYESQGDSWGARNSQVWILPGTGDPPRCLNRVLNRTSENITLSDVRDGGCQIPKWSSDSKRLYYLLSDQGDCHLYTVDLEGNNQPITNNKIDSCGFSVDSRGEKCCLLAAGPTQPAEIFYLGLKGIDNTNKLHQVTKLNNQFIKQIQLSNPEEIFVDSFDQTPIQGWLLKPPDFDKKKEYPLVLYIHGGPAAQYGNTFFHEFQGLASNGFVVLYANPRGSLGREETFATCIQGNWGDLDYKDIMAIADYAEGLPFIDPSRMAIMGGSYGGFLTTWIIGNTGRFRCAISERGISNRHSAVGCNDYPPLPDGYWSGNPWDQPENLWQQSPLRFARNIHTPLLIIHSEGDLRCPISQAEQLFSALKKLDREVVFLRYPAETSHGLSRNGPPDLRTDRLRRILSWLGKYLQPTS